MKITLLYSVTILLTIISNPTYSDSGAPLKLGTASKGGNYYQLGESISSICKNENLVDIDVIPTKGSVDNINQLTRGQVDLAIVQNDIAFLAENGLYPFAHKIKDLRGIITFFFEPVYIITNTPGIISVNQLTNLKVNVGPEGSGLYVNSRIILNSQNLWGFVAKRNHNPADVLNLLLDGEIQAAFINNITVQISEEIKKGNLFLVPLSTALIESLTKTYPYFKKFSTDIFNQPIETVSVKSILICKKDLDRNVIHEFTKILYENFSNLQFPTQDIAPQKDDVGYYMSLKNWHKGSKKYFYKLGILKSQIYLKFLWGLLVIPAVIIITVLFVNISLFSFSRKTLKMISANSSFLRMSKYVNLKVFQYKYIVILLFMIVAYLTNMLIVQYLEHDWAIKHNIISIFDNRSFVKNLLWMFVFGGSGYEDKLFPQCPSAKFFATLIPLIGLTGVITIVGFLTSDHIKNRILEARGVKTAMIKNHIILCGWNENVPFLVKNLLHKNIETKRPIVILAEINEELPLEKYGLDDKMVTYVRGDASNKSDLDKANVKEADMAIIVADSQSSDPDAKSILEILTIEKHCKDLEEKGIRKNRDDIYTIAEIQDTNKFEAAYDALVNEIVLLGHIQSKVFVQSILNPGVSKFINEILTYNDFNDIYSLRIEKNSELLHHTFDQLLVKLREDKILLLSINIENHRSEKEIESIKKEYNLERGIITNPINKEERDYRTQPGDLLIVLAQYEKDVQKVKKMYERK